MSPGAVLVAGSVDGFWPGVRSVPCLPAGPWEGEEERCVPRDFLGHCLDFSLGGGDAAAVCLALGWILLSHCLLALKEPLGRSGEGVKASSLAWELLLAAAFPFRGCWAEVCWYVCNAAPAGREHPALTEHCKSLPGMTSPPLAPSFSAE